MLSWNYGPRDVPAKRGEKEEEPNVVRSCELLDFFKGLPIALVALCDDRAGTAGGDPEDCIARLENEVDNVAAHLRSSPPNLGV